MQNTMLDSTISNSLQDKSSVPRDDTSPRNFVETFSCDVDEKFMAKYRKKVSPKSENA